MRALAGAWQSERFVAPWNSLPGVKACKAVPREAGEIWAEVDQPDVPFGS
jgi:hypothetical protein